MDELVNIIASRFITRRDVHALQHSEGYRPVKAPITRSLIEDHLNCNTTIGHYLVYKTHCKFFCFDIDWETEGEFYIEPDLTLVPAGSIADADAWYAENRQGPYPANPRILWQNRDPASRPYFKERLRTIGEILTSHIHNLGLPTCMTYSGSKGIHVYGFIGLTDAELVRAVALKVIADTGVFVPGKGANFFKDSTGEFPGMSLELFPKQSRVDEGHYGNLMRLEFGVNLKAPNDPCFLVNQKLPHTQLAPHPDPTTVLESGNPWA